MKKIINQNLIYYVNLSIFIENIIKDTHKMYKLINIHLNIYFYDYLIKF